MKLIHFDSLRARYITVALVLAVFMIIAAVIGYFTAENVRTETSTNIESRHHLMEHSRHIRQALWRAHQSLNSFLLDPHDNPQEKQVSRAIAQAVESTNLLIQHPWIQEENKSELLQLLKGSLLDLGNTVDNLIEIRKDPLQQYPTLAYGNQIMRPSLQNVINAMLIAINEISDQSDDYVSNEQYRLFVELRHLWAQMISNSRLHFANRFSTFDKAYLPIQIQSIETQFETLTDKLRVLHRMNEADELGFETSAALEDIQKNADKWFGGFLAIKDLHLSQKWRTDIPMIKNRLEPQLEIIWGVLLTVDLIIESSATDDVNRLAHLVERQTVILWLLTFVGLSFIAIVFIYFEQILFKPILSVSRALRAEATGVENVALPKVSTKEIRVLVDAFSTMRKQIHKRQVALEYQALHDELTGLANRVLLMDRLDHAIQHANRENGSLSLLIMDLDRFKEVNDTLGHSVGDNLLKEVGRRLMSLLRQVDTVARLGGDEFAILLSDTNALDAEAIARKISDHIEAEYHFNEFHLFVGCSIGISVFPENGSNAQELIQCADVAMYVAKKSQRNYSFYRTEDDQHSIDRLTLVSELKEAIKNNEIELHYQPKLDLQTEIVQGVEALLRWKHPRYGQISPEEIIPLAEQTGLVNPLFFWVLENAFQQLQKWQNKGFKFTVALNLSTVNLQNNDLVKNIEKLIVKYEVPRNRLILEITESAMMLNPNHAMEVLSKIRKMGIRLTVDDFGTGYSSLTYLKQLPVDEIKIDKSFVMNMIKDKNDQFIVRSIIELAHNMGRSVIAEGVETEQTWELLKSMNCDAAQGFLKKPAVTAKELESWLKRKNQVSPQPYPALAE